MNNEKHLNENVRIAYIGCLILSAAAFLYDVYYYFGRAHNTNMMINGVMCAAIFVMCIIMKMKVSVEKLQYVVVIMLGILYTSSLIVVNSPAMMVCVYPVAILIGMLNQKKIAIFGSVYAIVNNITYTVYLYMITGQVTTTVLISDIVLVTTAILLVLLTSNHQRQSIENVKEISNKAEIYKEINEQIRKHSEELLKKFEQANELMENVRIQAETSNESVREIADATKGNADTVEVQTVKAGEMQESIEQVNSSTMNINELAKATEANVNSGVKTVIELQKQAEEVSRVSADAEEKTMKLEEAVKEVESIVDSINGISQQTNLLALNASIEAARAGEAGRGFAVVAEEIRKLSEETQAATDKIANITRILNDDADSAINSMSMSVEYTKKQGTLITETSGKLNDISEMIVSLYQNINALTDMVTNMVDANKTITDGITNLSATSEQIAASTENVTQNGESTVDSVEKMSGVLNDIYGIAREMEEISNRAN